MQNAKDTFYITLRDRVAALNPARTVLVRGQSRPGVLVEENELAAAPGSSKDPQDAFRLRWTGTSVDPHGPLPLVTLRCEILYATAGNSGNGGMDRGRLLSAMDAELAAAVNAGPQHAVKTNYTASSGPATMHTSIFWGDLAFSAAEIDGELLQRTATVDVFSYQEAGEL
jgi:hypothetical protein